MKTLTLLFLCLLAISTIKSQNSKIKISDDIILEKISDSFFVHTSWHEFSSGRYPSNGLLFVRNGKAIMIDTPATNNQTQQICEFLKDSLNIEITKVIAGHSHIDCIGGLSYLHEQGVVSIAGNLTYEICKKDNLPLPKQNFQNQLKFNFEGDDVICKYFGGGHTVDNIVVYFPKYQTLFGGCLVKASRAKHLGNIAEADLMSWDTTIEKIQSAYKDVKIVIPGHMQHGGSELLDHTKKMVKQYRQNQMEKAFKEHNIKGCFVLFDANNNTATRYHPNLCDTGYIPASTFKIPHSVIALEEGLVTDTTQIKWNKKEWPHAAWNQDQTLATAMKFSCIWVYIDFAEKLGIDKYQKYINDFDYGNKNLTGPPTHFWLSGEFKVSANQQIDFLKKFYSNKLAVSQNSIDIVKAIMVQKRGDNWVLSGKTGAGVLNEDEHIMWFVGHLEENDRTYLFSMNYITDNYNKTKQARIDVTKKILMGLNLMK